MSNEEDKLKQFADEKEGTSIQPVQKQASVQPVKKTSAPKATPIAEPEKSIGSPIVETHKEMPWERSEADKSFANQVGWEKMKIEDLPTQGLFYPEGTEIVIRSATAGEIRHWSTIQEDDLYALDDMLNYIIERCAKMKYPNGAAGSWKDIKEVDRFYIILAVRERTFSKGENLLQVKVSETEKVTVTKDMIDYINFDPRIMKYYDQEKRTIILRFEDKEKEKHLPIYMTSAGVTNWLKTYINRKQQQNEAFDQDFVNFAPLVIPDWRGLNDSMYEKFVYESRNWSNLEISMLTEIRDIFADTINPVVKYQDEQGGERTVPLSFHGGIKSLFLVSNPLSKLT